MADDDVDITIRLRDELSREADRAERALGDLERQAEGLESGLDRTSTSGAELGRELHALRRAAGQVDRELAALRRAAGSAERGVDGLGRSTSEATSRLRVLQRELDRQRQAVDAAARSMRRQQIDRIRQEQHETRWSRRLGVIRGRVNRLGQSLDGLGARMKKAGAGFVGLATKAAKLPAILTAVTLGATAVSALGAAGFAAVAGLAPLVGLAPGLGALGLAALQAKGVFTMAMDGITEAVGVLTNPTATAEQLAEALKDLGPDARQFAMELADAKRQTDALKKSVQAGVLPGMADGLRAVLPLLPIVERNLRGTAEALGELTRRGGREVGKWGADIDTVMSRNTRIIGSMGLGALSLLNVIRHLVVEAGPMVEQFAAGFRDAAYWLSGLTNEGRRSGALTAFFVRTASVARGLWSVLSDVGVALFNVGRESGALAGMMGTGIADAAAEFRAFTESVEGKASIKQFFADAIPVITELGLLIRDAVKMFGSLAGEESLAPIISQIRTDVLPAMGALATGITTNLGPAFVDLFTAFLEFSNVLSFNPLITAVGMFADLARAVTGVVALSPELSTFLASLLTAKLVMSGASAAGGALWDTVDQVKGAYETASSAASTAATAWAAGSAAAGKAARAARQMNQALKAGLMAQGAASMAQSLGPMGPMMTRITNRLRLMGLAIQGNARAMRVLGVLTRIQTALMAVMGKVARFMFGPWGIALMVIIGAFVLLYKKNEAFRELVQRVGRMAMKWFRIIGEAIQKYAVVAFQWLVKEAKRFWTEIQPAVKMLARILTVVLAVAVGALILWFRLWWKVAKTVFTALWGAAKFFFKGTIAIAAVVIGGLVAYFKLWWKIVSTVFKAVWGVAKWVFDKLAGAARVVWGKIRGPFQKVKTFLGGVFTDAGRKGEGAWSKIKTAFGAASTWFSRTFGPIKTFLGNLWNGVTNGAESAMRVMRRAVNGIIDILNVAIRAYNSIPGVGDVAELRHIAVGAPTLSPGRSSREHTNRRGLFTGGYATAGEVALTGELGPELFVPTVGPLKVVGGDGGAALTRFSQPGYVVPAAGTPRSVANDVPSWVLDRLGEARTAPVAVPQWVEAKVAATVPAAPAFDSMPPDPIPAPIINVYPQTEMDVEAAVERAYRRIRRSEQERR